MANTKSAIKQIKKSEKNKKRNASSYSKYKTYIRNIKKIIDSGNINKAKFYFIKTQSVIDKTVKLGLIHKNKASRLKQDLNSRIKNISNII